LKAALALVPALAAYVLLFRRFDFVCDDAFITFEYARHLAEGHGLRFNAGGARVEGYSNFLWVLANALAIRLGADPAAASRLISFACGLHLLATVAERARTLAGGRAAAGLASGLWLAGLAPFAAWSSSGLETMPFAWATFLSFDRLTRDRPRIGAAAIFALLGCLLRTDGVVLVALAWLAAGAAAPAGHRRELARAAIPAVAALGIALVAYHAWRVAYFGEWTPQTARAKLSGSWLAREQGARYLATLAATFPSLVLAFLAPRGGSPATARVRSAAAAFALASFAYAGAVGGDWMAFGRFLVPGLPFLALSFGLRTPPGQPGARLPPARAGTAAAVILLSLPGAFDRPRLPDAVLEILHFRWNSQKLRSELEVWRDVRENARDNLLLGRALRLHALPGDSVVLGAIGAVAWETGLFVYDRNGLVTPEVTDGVPVAGRRSPGHLRNVPPRFFLDRGPTFLEAVLAGTAEGVDALAPPPVDVRARYERVAIPLRPEDGFPEGLAMVALRRREEPADAGP